MGTDFGNPQVSRPDCQEEHNGDAHKVSSSKCEVVEISAAGRGLRA